MKNGANSLNYSLCTTAALTAVWGDGTEYRDRDDRTL
jgi:spore coat protein U-like protein